MKIRAYTFIIKDGSITHVTQVDGSPRCGLRYMCGMQSNE